MAHKTVLVGSAAFRWSDWITEEIGRRYLLILDPADTHFGPAGRVVLVRNGEVIAWRFIGSLQTTRQPLWVLRGAVELLSLCDQDVVILMPTSSRSPIARHAFQTLLSVVAPDEILVAKGDDVDSEGWAIGPQLVELPVALPTMVQAAQRRGRWIGLQEDASLHEVLLEKVSIQGVRLGSGKRVLLPNETLLSPLKWAEAADGTLYVVSDAPPEEPTLNRALQFAHLHRVHAAANQDFEHLLCCMCRQNGEPLGMGMIERAEFDKGRFVVRAQVSPGSNARIVMIGSLKVDTEGKELGEIKPWSI